MGTEPSRSRAKELVMDIPTMHGRQIQRVGEPHTDGIVAFERPEYRFCPVCATELRDMPEHEEIRPTCPACGFIAYFNPVPAVGGVVLRERDGVVELLLVRRKYEPKKGGWSLPAGFMDFGERQVDALARELAEETGLTMTSASLLSVEDASEDPRTHALLIAFIVHEWSGEPRPGDDASEVGWFPLDVAPDNMAWRNHVRILELAREVIRR